MSTPNEQFRAFEAEQIKKGVTGLTNSVAMKTHPCAKLTKKTPQTSYPIGEVQGPTSSLGFPY